jgi:hypothetical protein
LLVQPLYPAMHMSRGPSPGVPGLVGRIVGGAGMVGTAYCQPVVLECVGALTLLLVVGVVFPAVWSRDTARRRAAAAVLRLLLTALVGARIATAIAAATPPVESKERRKHPQAEPANLASSARADPGDQ